MVSFGQQTLESMSQAQWYNDWLLKKIKPFIKGDILEVGCGIGNFTKDLVDLGNVWAIDIEDSYLKKVRRSAPMAEVGVGNIENGQFFFKDKKFDSIVCINVLEHIKDEDEALKNLAALLKKDGNLILLVPAHQFLYGEIDKAISHFRRYTKKHLLSKFQSLNLDSVFCREFNMLGAIGWFVAGRILKENAVKKDRIAIFNKLAPIYLKLEGMIEPSFGISVLIVGKKS